MRNHVRLVRATLTTALILMAIAGAAIIVSTISAKLCGADHIDYVTAYRLWRPLADQGNAGAQAAVGRLYLTGQGGLSRKNKWLVGGPWNS
jgi:TPR repeat protein